MIVLLQELIADFQRHVCFNVDLASLVIFVTENPKADNIDS